MSIKITDQLTHTGKGDFVLLYRKGIRKTAGK